MRTGGQHAFLVTGDIKGIVAVIRDGIERVFKRDLGSDPDYYEFIAENFDIEEARKIRLASQKAGVGSSNRFFVIGAENFLEKAQSALLKTLEEPIPGHYFFVITQNEHNLLLTVRSRMQRLGIVVEAAFPDVLSERFLEAALQDRLLMIPEIIDEDAESSTQRIAVKNFIVNLKKKVFDEYKSRDYYDKNSFEKAMTEISKAEKYSGDIASSPRLLLEFLAFVCIKKTQED